ncbi:NAD(P)H-dependent oxidoreductase [Anoxynatronum sibiricum]|uniref:NAD(P)H-dependent oxidoreductase n=1 Tax=Anoxynatronum sibiricum TaxID=210623 RepID=A0ABU9VWS2_9CLOT
MKITVIYGTPRKAKSSTYQIAQDFINLLSDGDHVKEFFLPKSMPHFCRGCWECFTDHTKCPDFEYVSPIIEAILEADLLILTAPVYVYHVPGQVKALLDHFGYQWMAHQPRKEMFHKQALLISTAAGAGTRSTIKDLKDSMNFWGIARTYAFGRNTHAVDWDSVDEKRKLLFRKDIIRIARKIKAASIHVTPCLKVKGLFYMMRLMHHKFRFNQADVVYWESHGWLEKKRPWDRDRQAI